MYRLGTDYEFRAEHRLPFEGGEESRRHPHDYRMEVIVSGGDLDENGFVVDIVKLRAMVKDVISGFDGQYLNDLEIMKGRTSSLENLARVMWNEIFIRMEDEGIPLEEVKVWETGDNWVSYSGSR